MSKHLVGKSPAFFLWTSYLPVLHGEPLKVTVCLTLLNLIISLHFKRYLNLEEEEKNVLSFVEFLTNKKTTFGKEEE